MKQIITEKDGVYSSSLTEKEMKTLVSILEIKLGELIEYGLPNKLDEDSVEEVYTQIVNLTEFDPNNPYGTIRRSPTNPIKTPRWKFITSLDKDQVIAFLLKFGSVNRQLEVERTIVAEQSIWIELPESIDVNAREKDVFGRDPVGKYIYEEVINDDDYSVMNEQGELGWSEINEYDIGDYDNTTCFSISINLPTISSYGEELKEVA